MEERARIIDPRELLGLLTNPLTLPTELRSRKGRLGDLLEKDIPEDTFICLIRALEISCRQNGDDTRNVVAFMAKKNFIKVHIFQYVLNLRAHLTPAISCTLTTIVPLLRHFRRYAPGDGNALRSVALVIKDIAKSYPPSNQIAQRVLQELSSLGDFESDGAVMRSHCSDEIFPSMREVVDREYPSLAGLQEENSNNIRDYVAIHFQLLRQEIVEPLRIQISRFHHLKQSTGIDAACRECCLFTDVSLLQMVTTHTSKGVSFRVSFKYNSFEEIEWETSHYLAFGSLVCLTSDNFHDMIFAVVAKRDPEWLKKGAVELRLLRAEDIKKLVTPNLFRMADTQTYIEEHFSVLNALQSIVAEEESMAFADHIVLPSSADNETKLVQEKPNVTYDVGPLVRNNATSQSSQDIIWSLDLTKPEEFPAPSQLNVDCHQLKAIKEALTKEVTVIKGSRGTGKTHTCLKIVHLKLLNKQNELLFNSQIGTTTAAGPILFICSTRASLDEFLTGVLGFQKEGVVGYGGKARLCSTPCTLESRREQLSSTNDKQHTEKLKMCNKRIEGIIRNMKNMKDGILSTDALEAVMDVVHFRSFRKGVTGGMLFWLLQGTISRETFERMKRQIQNKKPRQECADDAWVEGYMLMDVHPTKLNVDPSVRSAVHQILNAPKMSACAVQRVTDVWKLQFRDRWCMYRYWVDKILSIARDRAEYIYRQMADITKLSRKAHQETDHRILQSASVIGMTTSSAVKVSQVLKRLRTSMVIIDEADDVLQATSAAILPVDCKQLVLIGDGYPKINQNQNVKRLAAENGIAASLIERLSMRKYQDHRLRTQHRMSPAVSKIGIKLSLTDEFEHDSSNAGTCSIADIANNVCFIEYTNEPSPAKYESSFLIGLSEYLKEKGYQKDQITILTTFPGQLALFEDVKQHCQIQTLDVFRGESDIVLFLSDGCERKSYPGCLEIDQRLIFVLTCARKALFIIGNFKSLTSKNALWAKVIGEARQLEWVDAGLKMKCPNHPKTPTTVSSLTTYMAQQKDSGCGLPCNIRLECGHACKHDCHDHASDPDHKCMSNCRKVICENGHRCRNLCHEPCDVACKEPVLKELPCGHLQPVPCHQSRGSVPCRNRCERILPCGHKCTCQCGLPCKSCNAPCTRTLLCGHPCIETCGEICPTECRVCHKD